MDREKVIKALECRKNANKRCGNPCEESGMCHYAKAIRGLDGDIYKPFVCDRERICADALAMLKDEKGMYEQICEIACINDIGNLSDGYHTFNDLYYQRCILFATIVNTHKNKAWKTRYHEDGEPCFGGGWFLVTIETPEGAYGYHYEDKYWNIFNCKEIEKAKHWDGYTDKDVERLLSLT